MCCAHAGYRVVEQVGQHPVPHEFSQLEQPTNAQVVTFPCTARHLFHENCLLDWLLSTSRRNVQPTCPCCRESASLLPGDTTSVEPRLPTSPHSNTQVVSAAHALALSYLLFNDHFSQPNGQMHRRLQEILENAHEQNESNNGNQPVVRMRFLIQGQNEN